MTKTVTVRLQVPASATLYTMPAEVDNYMNETYISTGRMHVEFAYNAATAQCASTLSFATAEDKAAYFVDPKVIESMAARRAHNKANGIVLIDAATVD